jgi:hypothetical protein
MMCLGSVPAHGIRVRLVPPDRVLNALAARGSGQILVT